jgi:methyl-accepting chemotaxis protein
MIKAFKDSFNVNLVLTSLFFLGIAVSAYLLYRLPHNLMLPYGYESDFNLVYIVVAFTFLLGIGIISQALRYKKELVVFRERTDEMIQADLDAAADKSGAITIDGVKAALNTAKQEKEIFQQGLDAICNQLSAGQGAAYKVQQEGTSRFVELYSGFALSVSETSSLRYNFGEGLIGQAAAGGQLLYLDEVPEGYIKIISGLGSASPRYLLIAPIKKENSVLGILEIASFAHVTAEQRKFVEQSAELVAEKLSKK